MRMLFKAAIVLTLAFNTGMAADEKTGDFLSRLQDANADIRASACNEAKQAGTKTIVPLCYLMANENPDVAKAARETLTAIVHHAARPQGLLVSRWAAEGELIKALKVDHPRQVKADILNLLSFVGGDGAATAIAPLLKDPELAEDARLALQRIPDSAAGHALIAGLDNAAPEILPRIIDSLGQREDARAVGALAKYAESPDLTVSAAALNALARIGQPVGKLFDPATIVKTAPAEMERFADAYLRFADRQEARNKTDQALAIYKAVLIQSQAEHHKCAAIFGIGRTGGTSELLTLFSAASNLSPTLRAAGKETLINLKDKPGNLFVRQLNIDERLLRMYEQAEPFKKAVLLEVISARKSPDADKLVLAATNDVTTEVRQAAYQILSQQNNMDSTFLETTLQKASRDPKPEIREVGIKGLLRIAEARLATGNKEAASRLYVEVLELATGRDTKAAALRGLTLAANKDTAEVLKPLLSGDVSEEAGNAYLAIAREVAAADKNAATLMLRELVLKTTSSVVAGTAITEMNKLGADTSSLASQAGFVTDWWIIGAFPNENKTAFEKKFFPEYEPNIPTGGKLGQDTLSWRKTSCARVPAILNLRDQFGKNVQVAAYACARIKSPKEQEVKLKVGSDDGVVVWLNKEQVFSNNEDRGMRVDGDVIPATLKAGNNVLLVKSLQGDGDWGFVVRLTNSEDAPLDLSKQNTAPDDIAGTAPPPPPPPPVLPAPPVSPTAPKAETPKPVKSTSTAVTEKAATRPASKAAIQRATKPTSIPATSPTMGKPKANLAKQAQAAINSALVPATQPK